MQFRSVFSLAAVYASSAVVSALPVDGAVAIQEIAAEQIPAPETFVATFFQDAHFSGAQVNVIPSRCYKLADYNLKHQVSSYKLQTKVHCHLIFDSETCQPDIKKPFALLANNREQAVEVPMIEAVYNDRSESVVCYEG